MAHVAPGHSMATHPQACPDLLHRGSRVGSTGSLRAPSRQLDATARQTYDANTQ